MAYDDTPSPRHSVDVTQPLLLHNQYTQQHLQVHFDFDANGQAVGTANTSGDNLLAGDARRIDAGNKRGGTGRVRSGGLPDADQEGCREYTRHLVRARI